MAGDVAWDYVALLLPCDGSNGGTSFPDVSVHARTATVVGNTQTSTAQAKYGTASAYFDGTGDSLTFPTSSDLHLTTGDFTIEFWVYHTINGSRGYLAYQDPSSGTLAWRLYTDTSTRVTFETYSNSGSTELSGFLYNPTALTSNAWHHIAVSCKRGTFATIYLFVNGVLVDSIGSVTPTMRPSASGYVLRVGAGGASSQGHTGYMDDVRITAGVARYVSAFTPPTEALPIGLPPPYDDNFADVSFLLHADGSSGSTSFTDSSALAHTITAAGNAQVSTTTPKWGTGALSLDGTGDYLSVPYHAGLHLSTGDFTVEFWINCATAANTTILSFGNSSTNQICWQVFGHSGGYLRFVAYNDAGTSVSLAPTANPAGSTWKHFAITRAGSTWRMFADGELVGTATSSESIRPANNSAPNQLVIGADPNGTAGFAGLLDDVRITAGVARYTASFIKPLQVFADSATPNEAMVLAASPLQPASALASHLAGWAAAGSPLQPAAAHVVQVFASAAAGSPLQNTAATLALRNLFAASSGPLASSEVVAWHQVANARASSPLQPAQALAYSRWATLTAASPLQPSTVFANVPLRAIAAAGSPLQPGASLAWHDFSSGVVGAVSRYVMDLIVGASLVRVPITSWQATLQTDDTCYVQCVIHDALTYADEIASATAFIISRTATTSDGLPIEYEMATSPLESRITDRGPSAYTATISGYADAFTPSDAEAVAGVRALSYVRSVNTTDGLLRARADIDWLLRPGMQAEVDGIIMDVSYINYYVTSAGDQYMDCGERA